MQDIRLYLALLSRPPGYCYCRLDAHACRYACCLPSARHESSQTLEFRVSAMFVVPSRYCRCSMLEPSVISEAGVIDCCYARERET